MSYHHPEAATSSCEAIAEAGWVVVDGPGSLVATLTPEQADDLAHALFLAAVTAKGQEVAVRAVAIR